jgi:4-hydroxymandelate oxidase
MTSGVSGVVNVHDFEELAREHLSEAAYHYFAGGAADELTLDENRAALRRIALVPRVLRATADRSTTVELLGRELSFPVLVAPMAYQKVAHPEGELATARAAAAAGTAMCVSSFANHPLEEIAAAAQSAATLFFQLYPYRDRAVTAEVVARAEAAGYQALFVTVDVPVYGRRERERRRPFTLPDDCELPCVPAPRGHVGPLTPEDVSRLLRPDLSWRDIEELMSLTALPLVLKGLLSADDARIAADVGAAGVVVSNHGGRQLDTAIAAIDALPAVTAAAGDRLTVLMDGGVRRGTDVLKALALGARAVLVGRPVVWALAAGGRRGVEDVLRLLHEEIADALVLAGCATPADATPELVHRRQP